MSAETNNDTLVRLSRIIVKQRLETVIGETGYKMDVTVLEPSARIQLDQGTEQFVPVSPDTRQLHALQATNPDSARGILLGLSRKPDEIAASFVLSTLPDHESLFGSMIEAGFNRSKVIRAALHGIPIPLSSGVISKALFRTSHEYWGTDTYATQVHPSIQNQEIRSQTLTFMSELATATYLTLAPFVRDLTGNQEIGRTMTKVAFDPITKTYLRF